MSEHQITWIDHGREPRCEPDPAYPDGKDVDARLPAPMCFVELPYPAARCGIWRVECRTCGVSVGVTAAGRRDDPRSVRVPCRTLGASGEFPAGKLGPDDEGALTLAISIDAAGVRIDFGKEIAWLAMSAEEATGFAEAILRKTAESLMPAAPPQ